MPVDYRPYLPRLTLDWLGEGGPRGVELAGAVLFADVSGFTALAERLAERGREGAEELVALVDACFAGMVGTCLEQGGDVLNFGGDALLVYFAGEGSTERACAAAWLIRDHVERPRATSDGEAVHLEVSIGIHRGSFVAAVIGEHQQELVTLGQTISDLTATESAASPGEILLTEAVSALLPPDCWTPADAGRAHLVQVLGDLPVAPWQFPAVDQRVVQRALPATERDVILAGFAGEHRRVTPAFLTLVGTDRWVRELRPVEVGDRLHEVALLVEAAAADSGVHWLESDLGRDAVKFYVVGGAPISRGDDEVRIHRFLRAVRAGTADLDLRMGVASGPAFCTLVGGRQRRTYAVMGDPVNLAARLSAKAQGGQLLASKPVSTGVRPPDRVEQLSHLSLKGKRAPVDAVNVVLGRVVPSPLIGRDDELAALSVALERLLGRAGRPILVTGESGIGKTALLAEVSRLRPEFSLLTVRPDVYAASTPYAALRPFLRELFGVATNANPAAAALRLATWSQEHHPEGAPLLPLIGPALAASVPPTARSLEIGDDHRAARAHDLLAEMIDAALSVPVLIVIDDADQIDAMSLELLSRLADASSTARWGLAFAAVDPADLLDTLPDDVEHIAIEPLDDASMEKLVRTVRGGDELGPVPLRRVLESAQGNPLHVQQLVAASGGDGADATSLEALIGVRIDGLPAATRLAIRQAAVLGRNVEDKLLRAVLGDEAAGQLRAAHLEDLLDVGGDGTVRFRNAIVRQVAYDGLPFRVRRGLHAIVAEHLAARDDPEQAADLLVAHYAAAGNDEQAWRWGVIAGDAARASHAPVEALAHYTVALESGVRIGLPSEELLPVREAVFDVVAHRSARFDLAEAVLADAMVDATGLDAVRLRWKLGWVKELLADYPTAIDTYLEALAMLADVTDETDDVAIQRATIHVRLASSRFWMGDRAGADEEATLALQHARVAGDKRLEAYALDLRGCARTYLAGADGRTDLDAAIGLLETLDDLERAATAYCNLGVLEFYEGHWPAALEAYRRSEQAATRIGDLVSVAEFKHNRAELLLEQGQLEPARELMRHALGYMAAAKYHHGAASARMHLATIEMRAGEHDAAQRSLASVEETFRELAMHSFVHEVQLRRLELQVAMGRFPEVLEAAEELLATDLREDTRMASTVHRLRAWALLGVERPHEALAAAGLAVELAASESRPYELALAHRARAAACQATGVDPVDDRREAGRLLDQLGISTPHP